MKYLNQYQLVITVSGYLKKEKDGRYVAYCEELDTPAWGDTQEEAKQNIIGIMNTHLSALIKLGKLDEFLKERNIKIQRTKLPSLLPFQKYIEEPKFELEYAIPALA